MRIRNGGNNKWQRSTGKLMIERHRDIDTQFQEVKEHTKETVEEIESNDGSKCTNVQK